MSYSRPFFEGFGFQYGTADMIVSFDFMHDVTALFEYPHGLSVFFLKRRIVVNLVFDVVVIVILAVAVTVVVIMVVIALITVIVAVIITVITLFVAVGTVVVVRVRGGTSGQCDAA